MRLFVAINLSADLRQRIFDLTAPLRNGQFPVRWVMPDSMHITLKFLGEVDDERARGVGRIMKEATAAHRPFRMRVGPIGAFPGLRRPRVLWVGVTADDALFDLHREIETDLVPLGFEAEARRFNPHLTLARARNEARSMAFNGLEVIAESIVINEVPVDVRKIDLMQSSVGRAGASYQCIDRFELIGTGDPE